MQVEEPPAETYAREFFFCGTQPTSTHEEWLLRLCSQLMHREASVISMMEANAKNTQRRRSTRNKWRTSSNGLHESNSASTGTEPETSETS